MEIAYLSIVYEKSQLTCDIVSVSNVELQDVKLYQRICMVFKQF